ncbi:MULTISPECIES: D-alanyl-D-alanine carboxypeptidase family protein [Thioalkalivibrio]|uniref:D-alanyl-D-alanine carboxypeptidase family protein n=1 Tax=Thioalkalivibrio TaxID=106633 RepID=UPI0003824538|nr:MULTISPECIES: D-alanyl-D-alanine carboxypeptidase family protein [Thioalkalivibrio]OOC47814.1 serine-type D-Ala-D-Ala carboxypeptidase [Thioalkalivibrio versutus]
MTLSVRIPFLPFLVACLLAMLVLAPVHAQEQQLPVAGDGAITPSGIPRPPSDVTAGSYALMDFDSGLMLASREPQVEREPASLTKVMTAYVVFGEITEGRMALDDMVTVSERAWRTGMTGASRMFIEVGEEVAVEDLLRGMIVQSGNDASTALAEHVAGSEGAFVDMMNSQARELGMRQSYFANPHGLPSEESQYTTAQDMVLLARALIRDFPDLYGYYSERSFEYNDISQSNRNMLLWRDSGFDGLKTGWTSSAGYNLVSSAKRNDRRLVAAVMGIEAADHQQGGTRRANESQALVNWGMRFTATRKLFEGAHELGTPRVYRGADTEVAVGLAEDFWVMVPPGREDDLDASMEVHQPLEAPLAAGDPVGEVVVRLDGEVIRTQPLVALHTVEQGGLVRRLWDGAALGIQAAWPF